MFVVELLEKPDCCATDIKLISEEDEIKTQMCKTLKMLKVDSLIRN